MTRAAPGSRASLVARPAPSVPGPAPSVPRRHAAARRRAELAGRAGLAASLASIGLTFGVAVAGPSVMEPALPGSAGQPPWSLGLHPPAGLAIGLATAALAAGTTGLGLCLHAARRGWTISPRLLLGAGLIAAAALALAPPFGSADHLNYAAYGRMAVTGHDPYTTTPAMLARLGDPVARAVQDWRHSPSVYGGGATDVQSLAAATGGRSVRLAVFVLSLVNLAAFAGTGLLAHRLARGRRDRQLRAALLWTSNPLLLQVLVAGAHVDGQAVCFAVAALALFCLSLRYAPRETLAPAAAPIRGTVWGRWRQRPQHSVGAGPSPHKSGQQVIPAGRPVGCFLVAAGAGAAAGLAFGIKLSLVLVLAGLVLAAALAGRPHDRPDRDRPDRDRPGRDHTGSVRDGRGRAGRWRPLAVVTGGLITGFAAMAAATFAPWGTQALGPALRAGSHVSIGSPWRAVRSALRLATGEAAADGVVRAGAVILAVAVLALFARPLTALARDCRCGRAVGLRRAREHADWVTLAGASLLAVVLAWLVAWPYVLPWYDGLAWAFLAVLPWLAMPWAALDWLVLARTTALALGYLPARGIALPAGLGWLRTVVRTGVTPLLLLATTVVLVVVLWPGGRERSAAS
jgi:hypothetical protein